MKAKVKITIRHGYDKTGHAAYGSSSYDFVKPRGMNPGYAQTLSERKWKPVQRRRHVKQLATFR